MKVRSSVKPICEKCKVIKRKEASELSVKTRSTNRDRDDRKHLMRTSACAMFEFSARSFCEISEAEPSGERRA